MNTQIKIGVIGLGYVGLPLACLFATKYKVYGYDVNTDRINRLRHGYDATGEVDKEKIVFLLNKSLVCTENLDELRECNIYIVTVPTPVDANYLPDLSPLQRASESVGKILSIGDIVIYESTVYPGCTEEECVPVLARYSGLQYNNDFFVGYSPERINPGDKVHTVEKIKKVTSGSTPETAEFVDWLYSSVLVNGTYKASSIKVAEASKIIENTQRDVNIALMNELSKIFNAMNIDTQEVLEAAATKWNFIRLKPGFVGGHCIGVDPYYLIYQAQKYKVFPHLITEARHINETMGKYVVGEVVKKMYLNHIMVSTSKILLLGFAFKENCPDIRNTKVIDVYTAFHEYTPNVVIYDPWVNPQRAKNEYEVQVMTNGLSGYESSFDAIVLCVAHHEFLELDLRKLLRCPGIIYDVKGILGNADYRL